MIKKILLLAGVIFLGLAKLVSAADNITPTGPTPWVAGGNPVTINWNFPNLAPYNFNCPWHVDLFPALSGTLPTYALSTNAPVSGGAGSLSLVLPNTIIPGGYKVRVSCTNGTSFDNGESVGVATISNSSYNPFVIPTSAPTTWTSGAGLYMPFNVSGLPVGVVINKLLYSRTTGVLVYSETYTNTTINSQSISWSAGTGYRVAGNVYYYKISANVSGAEYSAISPDITATTAPAQPATLTITSPLAGDTWVVGTTRDITWSSTNLLESTNLIVQLTTPTGSIVSTAISTNDRVHPFLVPNVCPGSIPNPCSWKIIIRNNTLGINAESGIFTIAPAGSPSTKFSINDRVITNASVNVRDAANGSVLGAQSSGVRGTVISGPTNAGGFDWWQINYDTGVDGWSAETLLDPYTSDGGDGDTGDTLPPSGSTPGWQDPPAGTPPDCDDPETIGCWPPVNTSSQNQWKGGILGLNGLVTQAFRFMTNPQAGYVLTSDAEGDASWQAPTGGTGGGISSLSQGAGITLTPNPITTTGIIGADFTTTQARVTGTCPAGQYMYQVNVGGDVACRADVTSGDPVASSWTVSGNHQYSSLSGRVGIGYSDLANAAAKFRVETNADPNVARFSNLNATANYNGISVHTRSDNATTEILNLTSGATAEPRFRVRSDGNVCIGDPTIAGNCRTSWPAGASTPSSCTSADQYLKWNGSAWVCSTIVSTGGVSSILAGNNVSINSTGAGGTGNVTVNAAVGDSTYKRYRCRDSNFWAGTYCELPPAKFCMVSGIVANAVAQRCNVFPTTSQATSVADALAKAIPYGDSTATGISGGQSFSGAKWWYVDNGNLECMIVCQL